MVLRLNLQSCTALAIVCAASCLACQAGDAVSFTLATTADRIWDCDPLYFEVRLRNDSQEEFRLAIDEHFSVEVGDAGIQHRPFGVEKWKSLGLGFPSAGGVSAIRKERHSIMPGRTLDLIECAVPASFAGIKNAEAQSEFRATFVRANGVTMVTNVEKITILPTSEHRDVMLQAAITLIIQGPKSDWTASEQEAIQFAAGKSQALGRIASLTKAHQNLWHRSDKIDQEKRRSEFVTQLERLPDVEREFWAFKFAKIHNHLAAKTLDADPIAGAYHLAMCDALDKALGTSTENAQSIRRSCAAYRARSGGGTRVEPSR